MYKEIELKLSSLKEPTAFNTKTFDELLAENVALAKKILSTDETEWMPLESDPYMKKLRVATLRQIHNQEDKKETVRQALITTATKEDLDHLGARENVFRDDGEYPYTNFRLTLLTQATTDLTIPHGTILTSDDDKHSSVLSEDVVIKAGELTGTGKVELQEFISQSEVKTENVVTELTFAFEVKQLGIFSNGRAVESDDRYRLRIIKENDRKSTAGAEDSYKYFAFSADSRIDDIKIVSEKVLCVDLYLASFDHEIDELMINKVTEAVSSKKVRPLNDKVSVKPAIKKIVNITATIEVFDLLRQTEIKKNIEANFKNSFFIAQNFTKSDYIRKCHIDGVYRVNTDFEDVITNDKEIIEIGSYNLNFVEAVL